MPSSNPAGLLNYKVRTHICLNHEKKISRPITKIITCESRPITISFCVADRHQSPPWNIFYVAALNQTNVASQLLRSRHQPNQYHERVHPLQPRTQSPYLQSPSVCGVIKISCASLSWRARLGYQDKAGHYHLRVPIHYGGTITIILFTGQGYTSSVSQYYHGVPMSVREVWQGSWYIGVSETSLQGWSWLESQGRNQMDWDTSSNILPGKYQKVRGVRWMEINIVGTLRFTNQARYQVAISPTRYWKVWLGQQGVRTRITNEQLIPFKIILRWLPRLRG